MPTTFEEAIQRALNIEKQLKLSANFPTGSVPYALRPTYLRIVGRHEDDEIPKIHVTENFSNLPSLKTQQSPFLARPKHTMKVLGYMDPYPYNVRVPKFDPWFRDVVREYNPDISDEIESEYMRDPSTPERVMKHFMMFDRTWRAPPKTGLFDKACHLVERMFQFMIGKCPVLDLKPETFDKISRQLDLTSSPGLPFSREFKTQGDCLDIMYDHAKRINHFAKFLPAHSIRAPPCMIAQRPGLLRVDELDEKTKARAVWAYPGAVKVIEMRYTIPIYERLAQFWGTSPYPVGTNMLKGLPMIIDHLVADGNHGAVSDISKMDQSASPQLIHRAFDIISTWLDFGNNDSSQQRNLLVYDFLQYYFIRTPILLPSGQLVRKYGGVPSGSGFTQLVDTLISLIGACYALLQQGYHDDDILNHVFAVGDDVAMSVRPSFSITKMSDSFADLGLEVNTEKVMFSRNCKELKFLGYSKDGWRVHRDFVELLKAAYFPEKFVGTQQRSAQRLLGQALASGLCDAAFGYFAQKALMKAELEGPPLIETDVWLPLRRYLRMVLDLKEVPLSINPYEIVPLM